MTLEISRGESVVVNVSSAPICDASGSIQGMVYVVADISKHRALEAQLQQSQKMEAVGRLAGGIAHDFNNLLTAIAGYSYLLIKDVPADSEARRNVEQIQSAAERASKLTSQLLTFSRRQNVQLKEFSLCSLVEDTGKMLQRLIGEDINLKVRLPEDPCRLCGDRSQIEQVLVNLAVNARDAMPKGGQLDIKVKRTTLSASDVRDTVELVPGPYLLVEFSDTGTGMDAATMQQIFDPFFTTKEVGKGTGLGLSTVYGIVEHHKGHISVESQLGSGTTFRVYLPSLPTESEAGEAVASADARKSVPTILVVEDEESVKGLMEQILKEQGYEVLTAANADEAEEICKARPAVVSLLLTDVVLPGRTGIDLYRSLKKLYSNLKVLCTSGFPENAIVGRIESQTALPFIQKPFSPADFVRNVEEILNPAGEPA